jgi:GrpB-like predicted nucleotidyltransferase (UPF0157 family)
MQNIIVIDYDLAWPQILERLRSPIWKAVKDIALTIEHVGSTSVPGLAAKPIIDIDIVAPTKAEVELAIPRLATLGYLHRGNLGIEDREAFQSPPNLPRHNLYLCPRDSLALANHLAVRDHLRTHPETAKVYGELKKQLADQFPDDIDAYVEGKTSILLSILKESQFPPDQLHEIEAANRRA